MLDKSSDILFSSKIFDYHTEVSDSENKNLLLSDDSQAQSSELSSAAQNKPSELHVTFQKPVRVQEQALIHSMFHKHLKSKRAGDVTSLNHHIASHEKTTSSYEELPH